MSSQKDDENTLRGSDLALMAQYRLEQLKKRGIIKDSAYLLLNSNTNEVTEQIKVNKRAKRVITRKTIVDICTIIGTIISLVSLCLYMVSLYF